MLSSISENRISKIEYFAVALIIIGGFVASIAITLFLWNKPKFNTSLSIDSTTFGEFGSFLSGTVGVLWSLASIIYFVLALKEQRRDIKTNQHSLELQIQELREAREVSTEQSDTFKVQRFENTFFQLLQLHSSTVNELSFKSTRTVTGTDVFHYWKELLDLIANGNTLDSESDGAGGSISLPSPILLNYQDIEGFLDAHYKQTYYLQLENTLNHYFRQLYHLYKYVHLSDLIKADQRKFYAGLIRARLSQNELYAIAVNSIIPSYGYPKFAYLIRKYKVLKNFNDDLIPSPLFRDYIDHKIATAQNPF
ncbi:putative phage abortive infection protein [Pedobacter sp. AJM]|uniref:putative phage abortive infection protein n=1 Tax=Pedobacter sp. AJM TaxID=2003629 RepID=UPI000B4B2D82|nr:putative phage abortive infection protein [Pedobacter sp. AJM]OWK71432.1 hypothetical protein CBW18_10280 [Pedobacter sp. AJM]